MLNRAAIAAGTSVIFSWSFNPHYHCGHQPLVAFRECLWITLTVMAIIKPAGDCFGKSQWQNLAPAKGRQVSFRDFYKVWMVQVWVNNNFLQTIYLLHSPDAKKIQVKSSLIALGILKQLGEHLGKLKKVNRTTFQYIVWEAWAEADAWKWERKQWNSVLLQNDDFKLGGDVGFPCHCPCTHWDGAYVSEQLEIWNVSSQGSISFSLWSAKVHPTFEIKARQRWVPNKVLLWYRKWKHLLMCSETLRCSILGLNREWEKHGWEQLWDTLVNYCSTQPENTTRNLELCVFPSEI